MISVYISNNSIQAVIGSDSGKRVSIKKVVLEPLEPGCMLNGAIINASAIVQHLESMWKTHHLPGNVHLVVSSSEIHTKLLTTPILPEAKLRLFLREEFQDIIESEDADPLLDYTVLQAKTEEGGAQVLAAHVERNTLAEYVSLFTDAKISLEAINIGLSSAVSLVRRIDPLNAQTCIVAVFDGSAMMQILFVDGCYRFSKRIRLLSDPGSEELFSELARSMSNMIQFNKSEKTQSNISNIYFCGFAGESPTFYARLSEALGTSVSTFPASGVVQMNGSARLSDYLYPIGNLILAK